MCLSSPETLKSPASHGLFSKAASWAPVWSLFLKLQTLMFLSSCYSGSSTSLPVLLASSLLSSFNTVDQETAFIIWQIIIKKNLQNFFWTKKWLARVLITLVLSWFVLKWFLRIDLQWATIFLINGMHSAFYLITFQALLLMESTEIIVIQSTI